MRASCIYMPYCIPESGDAMPPVAVPRSLGMDDILTFETERAPLAINTISFLFFYEDLGSRKKSRTRRPSWFVLFVDFVEFVATSFLLALAASLILIFILILAFILVFVFIFIMIFIWFHAYHQKHAGPRDGLIPLAFSPLFLSFLFPVATIPHRANVNHRTALPSPLILCCIA